MGIFVSKDVINDSKRKKYWQMSYKKEKEELKIHLKELGVMTKQLLVHANVCMDIGLEQHQIEKIAYAAKFHDIGKRYIPTQILYKPAKLTQDEFEIMKQHTVIGYHLLKKSKMEQKIKEYACEICLHHHERSDGNGYPHGLKEQEIPIWVQIVALTDVYHALTHERCYKESYSSTEALNMMWKGECGMFNQKLLKYFTEWIEKNTWYLNNQLVP